MFFNSKEVAWADVAVFFSGKKIAKIKHVKFGKKQEKDELYAEGDEPHSIQRGNKSYPGELEVYKSAIDQINDAVAAAGYEDILDAQDITIVVAFKDAATRPTRTHTCIGCEFTDYEIGLSSGDKNVAVKLPFKFLRLVTV
jgi:hypothetical protein